jgi:hypothetical protein
VRPNAECAHTTPHLLRLGQRRVSHHLNVTQRELVASASELVASPSELSASPSELLALSRHADRGREVTANPNKGAESVRLRQAQSGVPRGRRQLGWCQRTFIWVLGCVPKVSSKCSRGSCSEVASRLINRLENASISSMYSPRWLGSADSLLPQATGWAHAGACTQVPPPAPPPPAPPPPPRTPLARARPASLHAVQGKWALAGGVAYRSPLIAHEQGHQRGGCVWCWGVDQLDGSSSSFS